jgi:hypothetical protein
MLNSIVEPFFLKMEEKLAFLYHKKGLATSRKIVKKILAHQLQQGDITQKDHDQILSFMESGYDELKSAQEEIERLDKEGKKPKYINFIRRPYLVHQLMMDILRLAIFSEARAKKNIHKEQVYTGRESGFEGSNTVAVHGHNNYLKYRQMLELVMPELKREKEELFDHMEGFKAWLMMGMHDAATYDRQNAISFGDQKKFGNNNKAAHNLIGAYILRENDIIKKLFRVSDVKLLETENEEKELNLLATIIDNHDYTKINLDIFKIDTDDMAVIKQFVLFTLSGIADNSAGIGFMDKDDKVRVDPWEEKGSSIFVVPAKDRFTRSNGDLMFEILSNISKDKHYYESDKGKAEWASLVATIKANVLALPDGIVKDKLMRGIEAEEFSPRSATSTAGVLNSGFMRFIEYDGMTLRMNIMMDKQMNKMLSKIMGDKFVFKRMEKFVEGYEKSGILKGPSSDLSSKGQLKIYNCDKAGNKVNSIGLDIRILEMPGILDTALITEASKQLLTDMRKYYVDQEFKETADATLASIKKAA